MDRSCSRHLHSLGVILILFASIDSSNRMVIGVSESEFASYSYNWIKWNNFSVVLFKVNKLKASSAYKVNFVYPSSQYTNAEGKNQNVADLVILGYY